jgi:RimJ/RimL family protein N-acetyltransferase
MCSASDQIAKATELSKRLGDLVFRAFSIVDAEALLSWASSPDELLLWSGPHFNFPLDEKQLRDYAASAGENRHLISVVSSRSDAVLAHAELNILPDHDLGQIRRVAVAPEARRRGIGTKLMRWLIQFAFMDLHLHRLELVVFSFNWRARRCYEAVGFIEEGYARGARKASGGAYWDLVYMALLSR